MVSVGCLVLISDKLAGTDIHFPAIEPGFVLMMTLALILMPVNWILESEKWRMLVPQERLTPADSFKVVLRGLALNWIVPFTAGDAIARADGSSDLRKSAASILINRVSMLTVTLLFGGLSVAYYLHFELEYLVMGVAFFVTSLLILTYAYSGNVFSVSLLTLLRYFVFTLQFYLLISYFNPTLTGEIILLGIGWIFLFRTVIPALFGSLGVREASALVFFEGLTDPSLILLPCLLIWIINQVIPSILGTLFILAYRPRLA